MLVLEMHKLHLDPNLHMHGAMQGPIPLPV